MYNQVMYNRRATGFVAAVVAVLASVVGCAEPVQATMSLLDAVNALPIAGEHRDGYERALFPHWVDEDHDRCDTRKEVLIDEAIQSVTVTASCKVTEGTWRSYYDGVDVVSARNLDIDHMVPLAEAWDSGAWEWTTVRRQAYANDLADGRALAAVTATSNRSKGDKDPGEWLPPAAAAHCRYVMEWTVIKTRWGLTVDETEQVVLRQQAAVCGDSFPPVDVVS